MSGTCQKIPHGGLCFPSLIKLCVLRGHLHMGIATAVTETFAPRRCSVEEGQLCGTSLERLWTLRYSISVILLKVIQHGDMGQELEAAVSQEAVLEMVLPPFRVSLPNIIELI